MEVFLAQWGCKARAHTPCARAAGSACGAATCSLVQYSSHVIYSSRPPSVTRTMRPGRRKCRQCCGSCTACRTTAAAAASCCRPSLYSAAAASVAAVMWAASAAGGRAVELVLGWVRATGLGRAIWAAAASAGALLAGAQASSAKQGSVLTAQTRQLLLHSLPANPTARQQGGG